jgi:hypothetical protein
MWHGTTLPIDNVDLELAPLDLSADNASVIDVGSVTGNLYGSVAMVNGTEGIYMGGSWLPEIAGPGTYIVPFSDLIARHVQVLDPESPYLLDAEGHLSPLFFSNVGAISLYFMVPENSEFDISVNAVYTAYVPEPSSLLMATIAGISAIGIYRRHKRRRLG